MRTVTRTVVTCSPRELKAHYPERFKKEYEAWSVENPDYGWWDSTYEDIKDQPEYYVPVVHDYFTQYPPVDPGNTKTCHELAAKWEGVVSFDGCPVSEFDLYPKQIELQDMRLHMEKFIELTGFTWPNPFALDLLMGAIFTDTPLVLHEDPLDDYLPGGWEEAAESYLQRTVGWVPLEAEWGEPVLALSDDMDKLVLALQAHIKVFIKGFESAVLEALEKEYEYQQSEDCFIEQDHLEFELVVEERDEQEAIA